MSDVISLFKNKSFKFIHGMRLDNTKGIREHLHEVLTEEQKRIINEISKNRHIINFPNGVVYYNGLEHCDKPCSVIIGPCSCGAFHHGRRFGL